jgi:hypothetical protein
VDNKLIIINMVKGRLINGSHPEARPGCNVWGYLGYSFRVMVNMGAPAYVEV